MLIAALTVDLLLLTLAARALYRIRHQPQQHQPQQHR